MSASIVITKPEYNSPSAEAPAALTQEKGEETHSWLPHLPLLLIEHGIEAAGEYQRPISWEYLAASTDVLVLAWEEEILQLKDNDDNDDENTFGETNEGVPGGDCAG